jgi:hypothetical protein
MSSGYIDLPVEGGSGGGTGDMLAANNLSDVASVPTARANLRIDAITRVNNTDYTILSTDKHIVQTGTMSAVRTFTLPLLSSLITDGKEILVGDGSGTVSTTNYINIVTSGSDLFSNGSSSLTIKSAGGMRFILQDITSGRWVANDGPTGALFGDITSIGSSTSYNGIVPIAKGGTGSATQNFVDLSSVQSSIAGAKTFTDAHTISSNSANSLTVGPNGSTNPVLQIDSSSASQDTGIKITGTAAGTASIITAIASGAAGSLSISSKGAGSINLQGGGSTRYTLNGSQHTFTNGVLATASSVRFGYTGAADTGITPSVEAPSTYFNLGQTRQHSTGALSTQRDFRITPSIHSFVGASTLTNAAAFSIDGPSNGGTNATITNSSAIYVPTSALTNVGNSYGINVAASSGATNNYAGIFTGGNLGVGSFAPTSLVHISESNSATGNSNGLTIEQSGTGDALVHFLLSGVQRYAMGIDNSDSDKFKIGINADLGTSNLFTMTTNGDVGLGNATPGAKLDVVGTSNVTSASANSLTVGPNGSTNPVLQIDSSTASSATGIKITSAAASSAVSIAAISSAATETLSITSKGSASSVKIQVAGSDRYVASNFAHAFTIGSTNSAAVTRFIFTGATDASLTSATEALSAYFNIGQTRTHNAGAITLQRDFRVTPSVHAFGGASTITDAVAVAIDGPSNGGTNATITNSSALYIPTSSLTNVGTSYGLNVTSATGATNSYAAALNGTVVIGAMTSNANAILDVQSTTKAFMPPRMTTTQKNAVSSPTSGMVVYDSTLNKLCVYGASAWETVTSL